MPRKKLKKALIIVGIAVGAVLLLMLLLQTGPVENRVLGYAAGRLRKSGIELEAADLDYNLFARTVTLRGVRLSAADKPAAPPFFTADLIRLDPDVSTLIRGKYRVDGLVLENPTVDIRVGDDGGGNLPAGGRKPELEPPPEKPPAGIPEFVLDRVRITRLSVRYGSPGQGIDIRVPAVHVEADWKPDEKRHVFLLENRTEGTVVYGGRTLPLRELHLEGWFTYDSIEISRGAVLVGENRLDLSGRIEDFFSPPQLRSDFSFRIRPSEVLGEAAAVPAMAGFLLFTGQVSGSLSEPRLTGKLGSDGLRVEGLGPVEVAAALKYEGRRAVLEGLVVALPSGRIGGGVTVDVSGEEVAGRADLAWTGVDPRPLIAVWGPAVPVWTRTSGSIRAAWDALALARAAGEAEVRFERSGRGPAGTVPVSGAARASLAAGTLRVEARDLALSSLRIGGEAVLAGAALSGDLTARTPAVEDLIEAATAIMDEPPELPPISGALAMDLRLGGTLESPAVIAAIDGDGLSAAGLTGIALEGRLHWTPERLAVEELRVSRGPGLLLVSGGLPLPPAKGELTLRAEGTGLDLASLGGLLEPTPDVRGRLRFEASASGRIDALRANAAVAIADLAFRGQTFSTVDVTGGFAGGVIDIASLRAESAGGGTLEVRGTYALDNREFDASAAAAGLGIAALVLPGIERPLSATIDLRLEADGTPASPRLTASGTLTGVHVGEEDFGEIGFEARTVARTLRAEATIPALSGRIEARLGLEETRPFEARLDLTGLTFAAVAPMFDLPREEGFGGSLSGGITVRGELGDVAGTLAFAAELEDLSVETPWISFAAAAPFSVTFDPGGLRVSDLRWMGPGLEISAAGYLPRRGKGGPPLTVAADLDLGAIAVPDPIEASGRLRLRLIANGSLAGLDLSGAAALDDGRFALGAAPPIEDIRLEADLADNVLEMRTFTCCQNLGRFDLEGHIPLGTLPGGVFARFAAPGPEGARLKAVFADFDPFAFAATFAGGLPESLSGRLGGIVTVAADRLSLEDLTGSVSFRTFEIGAFGYQVSAANIPVLITLQDARAVFDSFALEGEEFQLSVRGFVDVAGTPAADIRAGGTLGLRPFTMPGFDLQLAGTTHFGVGLTGPLADLSIQGAVRLLQAGLRMTEPNLLFSAVDGGLDWTGNRVTLDDVRGDLNGGSFSAAGTIDLERLAVVKAALDVGVDGAALDYPAGLLSQIDADVAFASDGTDHQLSGKVAILGAQYTVDLAPGTELYDFLFDRGGGLELAPEPDPFLSRLALALDVTTRNPVRLDNNLARAELSLDVRVTGTAERPGLVGRAEVMEGGEIYLTQNTFLIEAGRVSFTAEERIRPEFGVTATTRARGYDIRLNLSGPPDDLQATMTSDPPLSEPNIVSLLVTGRLLEGAAASVLDVAGDLTLSFLTQAFTGRLTGFAARALGLESIAINTSLISGEEDPGARVTLTENVAADLDLILSVDLKDAQNRTWVLDYNPSRSLNLQGVKSDDDVYSLAVQHEIRFGLKRGDGAARSTEPVVRAVEVLGEPGPPAGRVREILGGLEGRRFRFFDLWEKRERIRELYVRNDYLQFTLETERRDVEGGVAVTATVRAGPQVRLEFAGADVPGALVEAVKREWAGSLFNAWATTSIADRLERHFIRAGYYRAAVEAREAPAPGPDVRRFIFDIATGPEFRALELRFEGNRGIPDGRLRGVIETAGLRAELFTDPGDPVRVLEGYYRREGYLRARVGRPEIRLDDRAGIAVAAFAVAEGPRFMIGEIRVLGNEAIDRAGVLAAAELRPGEPFDPRSYNDAEFEITDAYARLGYNDAEVRSEVALREDAGLADIVFDIRENRRDLVGDVRVSGDRVTRGVVFRRMLALGEGDVLGRDDINAARRYLLNLGVFNRVDIAMEPLPDGNGGGAQANRVNVDVLETPPWRFRYGVRFNTENLAGVTAELVNRNTLGLAILTGVRARVEPNYQDLRLFARSPFFFSRKITTDLFLFGQRLNEDVFRVDRSGVTLQQQVRFSRSTVLTYNAQYEGERGDELDGFQAFPGGAVRYGSFNGSFTRDTRDSVLDAGRGYFVSQSVELVPGFLGSDIEQLRTFGQYHGYIPLGERTVYAAALRLGFGWSSAGPLVPSKRFLAGGGASLRGFGRNEVGPRSAETGRPTGGNALVLVNQEIRFPVWKIVGGVVFLDLGNVYARVADFAPFDLRSAAGLGVRVNTPYVLLSADWGFNLAPRRGESRASIFFTIGQAF